MYSPFTLRTKDLSHSDSLQIIVPIQQRSWHESAVKNLLVLFLSAYLFSSQAFAQTTTTFPPASSCTSKDLTLTGASLPGTSVCNDCTPGQSITRTLYLSIFNKTGSTRTAFAFWGTLVIRNSDGTIASTTPIQGCGGPCAKNATTTLQFSQINYVCGQSLTIQDLYLAWTDASPGSTCASLNSATINPKCGILASIQINTGLDATFNITNKSCNTSGAIDMTPLGGKSPYTYSWVASGGGAIPAGQATSQDLSGLGAGTYTVTITDAAGCKSTRSATVTAAAAVIVNAGTDFKITCTSNTSGQQIGETAENGFTYSWSTTDGLSSNVSNPTATPSSTTTYILTKTNTASGCKNTDEVIVTVDKSTGVANAGSDFTKNCIDNINGAQIGETPESGFTYSWSSTEGLSAANVSNPTANPSLTTTYTVTKTKTSTGCSTTDAVTVTVDNDAVVANAGADFTKTCTDNINGKQIGEASAAGFSYSWSPTTGLSNANISNPTANPSSTLTYTVTKTNTSSGCSDTDDVLVTVNNTAVVANAGDDFTKTCTSNASGKEIGEASAAGFTYSWSPTTGLSNANISNPTANPSSTLTYTVTKTNTSSGCSDTDDVLVTVNTAAPDAPAFCAVQPSLCGPATGSITIKSPLGADYEYSINNGTSWQAGTLFDNLAAGSVTGIKVKNLSSGCISSAALCNASDCSQPSGGRLETITSTQTQPLTTSLKELNIRAFPNPFSDNVKFLITAPEAGNGSLEVFNSLGQKVKTVFRGHILPGDNMFQVNLPAMRSAQLFYILRIGDKKVTGKLLQLNR